MSQPDSPRYSDYVDYSKMDPAKRIFQKYGATTAHNIERFAQMGVIVNERPESRGESAYAVDVKTSNPMTVRIHSLGEGIGTKNMIARQARELGVMLNIAEEAQRALGKSFYRGVGICNAATFLNDLSTTGGSPVAFHLFVAAGSDDWFTDEERINDLSAGTVDALNQARSSWGGGESQTLRDMLPPDEAVLAASGYGLGFPDQVRYPSENNVKAGQRIVLIGTDNPQTNGFSLLRRGMVVRIAQEMGLPENRRFEAYTKDIGNGETYGEAILKPSRIYTNLMDHLLLDPIEGGRVPVAYATHITGHGWTKLMRPRGEFTYVIDKIPPLPPIFDFIRRTMRMSPAEMYRTYNNGAGYALFVDQQYVPQVLGTAKRLGHNPLDAGVVEEGPKRVVIRPLRDLTYTEDELQIK